MTTKPVRLESLGLCEHCGALLTIEGMPGDAMDVEWRCPKCKGTLSMKSFGYEGKGDFCDKIRWVGKNRKWTKTKPTEDFELGNWYIVTEGLPLI